MILFCLKFVLLQIKLQFLILKAEQIEPLVKKNNSYAK